MVLEPPIDLKYIPRSNMATKSLLLTNRNVWKGVPFLTPWGLLEGDDSAAPRSHDKNPSSRESVSCFQELWSI
jgi:hypothetical protein